MHSLIMLISLLMTLYFEEIDIVFCGAFLSFTFLFFKTRQWLFTWANVITTARFLLIVIAISLVDSISHSHLFMMLSIAVGLDVLDGYVARKLKQSSPLGLHYDMEVDAFFVMIMGVYFFFYRDVPVWVLIPGILRYLYTMMMAVWPKQSFVEKKQKYASVVAGLFFIILLISLMITEPAQLFLLGLGTVLIIASFSRSFYDYATYKGLPS